MHRNSLLLFNRYAKTYFKEGLRVLEIGPNGDPSRFKALVSNRSMKWETLDIVPSRNITYVASGEYTFPIPDGTFDIVFSGQVIEHVKKIWLWMPELARVCKTGGLVITINPVNWPYHEAPVDCWRIYPEGMRALYNHSGLEMKLCKCESRELKSLRFLLPNGSFRSGVRECLRRLFSPERPFVRAVDTISIGEKR